MLPIEEACQKYYTNFDYNCAETILHAANEVYSLNIPDDGYKLIGCFGGGIGCGHLCGAVAGACAAISKMRIKTIAHEADAGEYCTRLIELVRAEMGSEMCAFLRKRYFDENPDVRCIKPILAAARALDEVVNSMV